MAAVARLFRGSRFLMSPAAGAAAGTKKKAGAAAAAAVAKVTKKASAEKKPRVITSFMKPSPVSEELRRFAGAPEVARTEAMKLIWAHIKAHGLQNPAKKTEINCDATLKSLFGGRDKVGMTEIPKLLSPHFPKK